VGQYQKCKINLDYTEARECEWQWHQLGHEQVCTSLQADNYASTPPLSFLQVGCPSCSINSVKALKATHVPNCQIHVTSQQVTAILKNFNIHTKTQATSIINCHYYWTSPQVNFGWQVSALDFFLHLLR